MISMKLLKPQGGFYGKRDDSKAKNNFRSGSRR